MDSVKKKRKSFRLKAVRAASFTCRHASWAKDSIVNLLLLVLVIAALVGTEVIAKVSAACAMAILILTLASLYVQLRRRARSSSAAPKLDATDIRQKAKNRF